jgi:hypothetical protein
VPSDWFKRIRALTTRGDRTARAPAEGRDRLVKVEAAVAVLERRPAEEDEALRPDDPDQVLLMVPVQQRVPPGDLAHFVSDLVETGALDLSAIYASYGEERGYPPYDPQLMVKPLVNGYVNGVMSSRKVEAAPCRDVAATDAVRRPASRLPSDSAAPPGAVGAVRPGAQAVQAGAAGRAGDAGG